jgi:hypothetical protein
MPVILMSTFLVSAIIWPIATTYKAKATSVASLVVTAISSILLLAGLSEDRAPMYVLLSALSLSIVVVLLDAVVWNANYILQ